MCVWEKRWGEGRGGGGGLLSPATLPCGVFREFFNPEKPSPVVDRSVQARKLYSLAVFDFNTIIRIREPRNSCFLFVTNDAMPCYADVAGETFGVTPLTWDDWTYVLRFAAPILVVEEVLKVRRGRRLGVFLRILGRGGASCRSRSSSNIPARYNVSLKSGSTPCVQHHDMPQGCLKTCLKDVCFGLDHHTLHLACQKVMTFLSYSKMLHKGFRRPLSLAGKLANVFSSTPDLHDGTLYMARKYATVY